MRGNPSFTPSLRILGWGVRGATPRIKPMTFLNPGFLWLLSLASIPVILHLLSRIRLKRVNFSALYFLKDVKRERFSWLRLKEILLLILRTSLIIFLFLALARPKIQGILFPIKRQAHLVIIIDDSYSMGHGHRFETAKNEAKRILNQLSAGSEVMILTSSGSVESGVYQGKNLKLALSYIDSLSVSSFSSDLSKSLAQAQTDLGKSNFANKEIFVITDLQRRAFAPVLKSVSVVPKVPTYVIDVGGAQENCAVTSVFLSERFPQPSRPGKIGMKIRNYGSSAVLQQAVLNLDGKTEEKRLKLAGSEEKTVLFETEIGKSGRYLGSVWIEPDSLKIDDQRYFVFSIPERIPVLLVYSQKTDVFYLERALAPESLNSFNVITTDEKCFRQKNLVNFAAIGIINPANFTGSDWQRLNYFRQKGGKVFIALGQEPKDKTGLEPYCEYELTMRPTGFVSIDKVNLEHPILEVFSGIDLSSAKFFQWAKVKPKKVNVLASLSDGSPFLLESEDRGYVIACSGLSLDATDLVLKPIFLPLVQRIFFYLAKGDAKSEYEVGSTILTEVQTIGLVKIKTPKEEYSVMPEIVEAKRVVKLKDVKEPGIYQVGEKTFAVNIDPAESDLSRINENDLVRAGLKLQKGSSVRATDLTDLFLYLAFFVLALEMIFLLI
jgi:hypothetical protein